MKPSRRVLTLVYIGYQLNSVSGVAEVASVGGTVRQYQLDVDPKRLQAFKIPISTVVDAVMRCNKNVGGNVIEGSGTWTVIRGLGLIAGIRDQEGRVQQEQRRSTWRSVRILYQRRD